MKSIFVFLFSTIVLAVTFFLSTNKAASANVAGAPTGKTGSPGDGANCTQCHTGSPTNVAGMITSNIPVNGYIPGNTYTITATVTESTRIRFGFEISPQSPTGAQLGTLVVTNTNDTKLIGLGKWITHKSTGTSGTGSRTWSFDWIAPPLNSGTVTFYGAFNAANNNSMSSGDIIRLSTLVVPQDPQAGIFDPTISDLSFEAHPNPVSDHLNLIITQPENELEIEVVDLAGKRIFFSTFPDLLQGENRISLTTDGWEKGIYLVSVKCANFVSVKKIVKQ